MRGRGTEIDASNKMMISPRDRCCFVAAYVLLLHCTLTADAFCIRTTSRISPLASYTKRPQILPSTQINLYVDNEGNGIIGPSSETSGVDDESDEEQPHSVWYKRYKEYLSDTPHDYDFVLNDKELIESDPALNLLSSEVGVKEYFTKQVAPTKHEGIPFSVLLERTFDTVEDVW